MKALLFLCFFLLSTICVNCQLKDTAKGKDTIINGEHYYKTYTRVEKESQFKGGVHEWLRFLNKNLKYPDSDDGGATQFSAMISFVVDTLGHVSDIKIVNDHGSPFEKEAARVIKLSDGMWEPAIQNGVKIKSFKKQPFMVNVGRS